MDRRLLGQIGENAAADVLRAKGYRILKQNYRCRYGEIDIVAVKNGRLAFVEVKTRQGLNFGRPCESIDENKKRHIRKTASNFLDDTKSIDGFCGEINFQVVEVIVEHTENAF